MAHQKDMSLRPQPGDPRVSGVRDKQALPVKGLPTPGPACSSQHLSPSVPHAGSPPCPRLLPGVTTTIFFCKETRAWTLFCCWFLLFLFCFVVVLLLREIKSFTPPRTERGPCSSMGPVACSLPTPAWAPEPNGSAF